MAKVFIFLRIAQLLKIIYGISFQKIQSSEKSVKDKSSGG